MQNQDASQCKCEDGDTSRIENGLGVKMNVAPCALPFLPRPFSTFYLSLISLKTQSINL